MPILHFAITTYMKHPKIIQKWWSPSPKLSPRDNLHRFRLLALLEIAQPLRYLETNIVVVGFALFHVLVDYFPHFTGISATVEIHVNDDTIHEENQANAEYYGQVGLARRPRNDGGAQYIVRDVVVGDPHVSQIQAKWQHDDTEYKNPRKELGMRTDLKSDHTNNGRKSTISTFFTSSCPQPIDRCYTQHCWWTCCRLCTTRTQ